MKNIKKNIPILIILLVIVGYQVFQQFERKMAKDEKDKKHSPETISQIQKNVEKIKNAQYTTFFINGLEENPEGANHLATLMEDFFQDSLFAIETNPNTDGQYYRVINCREGEQAKTMKIDIAMMNPFQFFCFKSKNPTAKIIAYQNKCTINNIIAAPKSSTHINTLKDLKNTTMSILGTGASLILMRGLYPKEIDFQTASTALIKNPTLEINANSTKHTDTISFYSLRTQNEQIMPTVGVYKGQSFNHKYPGYKIIHELKSNLPCNVIVATENLVKSFPNLNTEEFLLFLEIDNVKKSFSNYTQSDSGFVSPDQNFEEKIFNSVKTFKDQLLNTGKVENFEFGVN